MNIGKKMKTDKYIVGIGAANMDIHGRSINAINLYDSNPGHMHMSVGGVTRNILENYARLGGKSVLLSVVGDDVYGDMILSESQAAGLDVSYVMRAKNHVSSTYMSILNNDGDMTLALSDMSIMEQLSIDYLHSNDRIIRGAELIVTDPSIPSEVMNCLLDEYSDMKIFVDPVSTGYARCIENRTGSFYRIKPNAMECGLLGHHTITDEDDLWQAAENIIASGTKEVYVSRGKEGCLYVDSAGNRLKSCLKPLDDAVNATGAGDAFMAMVIYGCVHGMDRRETLDLACRAGMAAIMSADTINKNISMKLIRNICEERRI